MTDSYPGNSSLPSDVKRRVLTTFRQTLDLFQEGRTEEAVAGCDYLLTLDQNFDPAKTLRARAASGESVDISEFAAFNSPAADGDELTEASQALADREFQRALDLSTSILTRDFTNETAQKIAEDAREKLEAAPFIDQFIQKARKQIADGKVDAARMSLDKARSLDPNHPDIQGAEAALPQSGFGAPAFNDPAPMTEQPSASAFVVDPQPQESASRSGDFGFKFEEEPKNDFSFDNPAAFSFGTPASDAAAAPVTPAPPSESNTFDFTTASIDVSAEDQSKIDQYLREGDEASAAGEIQVAIDLWSRIFLIDVTNDAASERIEKARGKRMELDKKVEDLMVAATLAYEKRDFATAKTKFEDVLRLDPRNFNAGEYLEKLSTQGEGAAAEAPPPSYARDNASDGLDDVYEGAAESLVPPSPAASRERKAAAKAAAAPAKKRSFGTVIAAAVALLILAAGGWFAFSKFKPAGVGQQTTAGTAEVFTRAQSLARGGKFDEAIALLSTVPPKSAEHDRALVMISELKAKKAQTAGTVEGRPAQEVYRELLGQAQSAFAAHDYVGAKAAFEKASVISALPPEMMPAFQNASQQVAKLDSAKLLFKEGNYKTAIANLESLLQQDPQNLNIRHLIGDAHFNLGRAALQDGRPTEGAAAFSKTLEFRPDDEEAKRSRELATRYEGQPPDLLYRIYVKYLPLR